VLGVTRTYFYSYYMFGSFWKRCI